MSLTHSVDHFGAGTDSCHSSPRCTGVPAVTSRSFVPLTTKVRSPTTAPRAATAASFDTKPFLDHLTQLRHCHGVVRLQIHRRQTALRLTLIFVTDGTFFMATLTAWAQISQSMPSVLISTWRSSARAELASNSAQAHAKTARPLWRPIVPSHGAASNAVAMTEPRPRLTKTTGSVQQTSVVSEDVSPNRLIIRSRMISSVPRFA